MKRTSKSWASSIVCFSLLSLLLFGCASYHTRSYKVQSAFANADLPRAANEVNKSRILKKNRNRLLFFLEAGTIESVRGNYAASNDYFEKAYLIIEDEKNNLGGEFLRYTMNPMMTDYTPENHEVIYIHYYKALNYLRLGELDKAMVEVKRMDNKIKRLDAKYQNKNKFQDDALIHLVMGLVYDAGADYNNAFIAYKNALKLYEGPYRTELGVAIPAQLKSDLIRTAYLSGFTEEGRRFEEKFSIKYKPVPQGSGTAIVIWQNGLTPIKTEAGFTFTSQPGVGGNITFNSNEFVDGFSFPQPTDNNERTSLNNMRTFRVVLPRYTSRPPVFNAATLSISDGTNYNLYLAEDVEKVARQCLNDRLLREMSTVLIRIAIKKGTEIALRKAAESAKKDNEKAGLEAAALGVMLFNTFSEKADTRNWQTLPNAIYYTRIVKQPGNYQATFKFSGRKSDERAYQIPITANNTYFFVQHTLGAEQVYPGHTPVPQGEADVD